ncbi:hypothetical protein [Pseudonocardia lacus]|uniref:hypothetical protein n=1 Tax=Pseudonocardia lacus TaxID=2835865 RepID=UPI001BDD9F74|nr:hypothetical protein [Pseudonocardia lacus]
MLTGLLADRRVPPATAAHAAVTLASHRRQLGGHAAARPLDALGLRLASTALREGGSEPDVDGADARAARTDALVGLAADALGTGDVRGAARLLDVAEEVGRGHPSWRPGVRAGWVRAELALLRGVPAEAVEPAERAVAASRTAGSWRHEVKSRIVLAVARSAHSRSPRVARTAVVELDEMASKARKSGLLPLAWPADLAAADLLAQEPLANEWRRATVRQSSSDTTSGATRRRHSARATLSVIVARADPVGRRLVRESPWLPSPLPVV